jgi:hypothetical protein
VDVQSFEDDVPGDELDAVARALGELGARPLPEAVALRLDARLAAELDSSPLALRRSRRPLRIGAGLSAAAAVAAALIFALSTGGGHHTPPGQAAAAGAATADSAAKVAAGVAPPKAAKAPSKTFAVRKACPPASRTGDGHRPAGCPGARGGHARAV